MGRNGKGTRLIYPEIFKLHPLPTAQDRDAILRCIRECLDCSASCTACADACLSEDDLQELVRCIRLNLDCADSCDATARILLRQSRPDLRLIHAAIEACRAARLACGEECERHAAHLEHCRLCAEICRRCQQACDDLFAVLVERHKRKTRSNALPTGVIEGFEARIPLRDVV